MKHPVVVLLVMSICLPLSLVPVSPCLAGFADINAPLTGVAAGSLAWGDYDNDGDLDLAVAGSAGSDYVSKVYRNDKGLCGHRCAADWSGQSAWGRL